MSVTESGSSTKSAPSLVLDQSLCTFFLLIGVSPIQRVFSNLASVYNLVSRGNDSFRRWISSVAEALVVASEKF